MASGAKCARPLGAELERSRRWLVLTVSSPSEALIGALAEGLIDLGGTAVQEEGLTLRTFIPAPLQPPFDAGPASEAADRFAHDAAHLLTERASGERMQVAWSWQPEENWLALWRAGLEPRRVGERLIIAPTWTLPELKPSLHEIVIAMDPKMAFGTGEHASTRGVLRLLERTLTPGSAVLDVGTGSGILAIAAASLGAASVFAVDNDPVAIETARENIARNRACGVELACTSVDASFLGARRARYDLILANVLRAALEPLLPFFWNSLVADGALIIGGILESEAEPMLEGATHAGFTLASEDREDGWWSARLDAAPQR